MTASKSNSLIARENELHSHFLKMTGEEIRELMNTTDNTTTRLTCWEYLQTI